MEQPNLPELPRNQRVILVHQTGKLAHLHQIIGHVDQFDGEPLAVLTPASSISKILRGETTEVSFSLVQSKPRYLVYQEIVKPEGLGTFDRNQR